MMVSEHSSLLDRRLPRAPSAAKLSFLTSGDASQAGQIVQMFFPQGQHANEAMADFINVTLSAKERLEVEDRITLGFNAGLFREPEEPFIMLGPITSANNHFIHGLVGRVPHEWMTLWATGLLASIVTEE